MLLCLEQEAHLCSSLQVRWLGRYFISDAIETAEVVGDVMLDLTPSYVDCGDSDENNLQGQVETSVLHKNQISQFQS